MYSRVLIKTINEPKSLSSALGFQVLVTAGVNFLRDRSYSYKSFLVGAGLDNVGVTRIGACEAQAFSGEWRCRPAGE